MITIRNRFTNEILKEVDAESLIGADLIGADLSGSNLRCSDLRGSDLSGADLSGSDLTNSDLSGSNLRCSDLTNSDLSGADLSGSDLTNSDLSGADLREATLQGVKGYTIPLVENLDAKILERLTSDPKNTLDMREWHTCETTHCRAGWAVVLAGESGKILEEHVGTNAAGALIYARAYRDLPVPDFYASNEAAMEDIKKRAGIK